MTAELILLRHAHAEPAAAGGDDADRPLNAAGQHEARDAGRWLATHPQPTTILCSPSRRTRDTLQLALPGAKVTLESRIYEATAGGLINLVDEHLATATSPVRLMLVGHNPGFETLVALLATGQSGDFRGMPPGAIAWLTLDEGLDPGTASLKAFWAP